MITVQDLKAAGYRGPYRHHHGQWCQGLYQKTVVGPDRMKLYFINVYLWEFPNTDPSASVEVVLYRDDGLTHRDSETAETSFHVNLQLGKNSSIAGLEGFYAELYEKLGCIPDLHNNDGEPAPPKDRFERV